MKCRCGTGSMILKDCVVLESVPTQVTCILPAVGCFSPVKVFLLPSAPISTSNSNSETGWSAGLTLARHPTSETAPHNGYTLHNPSGLSYYRHIKT